MALKTSDLEYVLRRLRLLHVYGQADGWYGQQKDHRQRVWRKEKQGQRRSARGGYHLKAIPSQARLLHNQGVMSYALSSLTVVTVKRLNGE